MDPLVATLLLILVALFGGRFSFSTRRIPAGPSLLLRTGIHFLVLGYLLGPSGIALVSEDAVRQLNPLLGLTLGWVGLLFGMQFKRDAIGQFPVTFSILALGQAVVTFAVVFAVGVASLRAVGLSGPEYSLLLYVAAAMASISTPATVAIVSSNFLVRGETVRLLFYVASVDALVGIVALQASYGMNSPGSIMGDRDALGIPAVMAVAVLLGSVCALAFLWLLRLRPGREELVLYLLGISALASGAALFLELAPLFVSVVMGVLIVNIAPDRGRVFRVLERWEKPVYVVLLVLAGALLNFPSWWVVPLALAYVAVRALAKVGGSAILIRTLPLPVKAPTTLGLGLLPQGGIVLAVAVSVVLAYDRLVLPNGSDGVALLFSVIVLGVVISELLGLATTVGMLRAAGAIDPNVEAALEEGDQARAEAEAIGRH